MSGCIVVATDVGGISDIIENGKTGFLVKEKNYAQLAVVINKILEKDIKLDQVKEATRRVFCRRFDWSLISDKYKEVLSRDQSK